MDNKAFYKIPYGLYIVSAYDGKKQCGCLTNTLMQISTAPASVAISVNKSGNTHDVITQTKKFNVSILDTSATFDVIKRFGFQSSRDNDKFQIADPIASNGIAYLNDNTNALICCDVKNIYDFGTHSVFEGIVTDAITLSSNPTMTYEYYQNVVKPKPQAPQNKTVWRCQICGWEYDGENLPTDIVCPLCKHGAIDFVKITK